MAIETGEYTPPIARPTIWRLAARFRLPSRFHARVYRLTGGAVGARLPLVKLDILLLTTAGCRTGKRSTVPLVYFRDGERIVVVASNRGNGRYPAWYWNLQFDPRATIQVGRVKRRVVAREARVEEREDLWPALAGKLPVLDLYQQRTPRELPVMILTDASLP